MSFTSGVLSLVDRCLQNNDMPSRVVSFRLSSEAIAQLRERSKPGESESQTAQRLLNELLGTRSKIELTEVDSRIQQALSPIMQELDELRDELEKSAA
ncbi:MAG: hypothetical protein F6K58_19870 [Symploca sp. SIO2E9]|nr:hypothetical protein [Symploca sp. SIO2E9]